MTLSPTVLVFLGFGTAYALLFHLWRGRNIQQLILFWLVSILGFGLGFGLAGLLNVHVLVLGGRAGGRGLHRRAAIADR